MPGGETAVVLFKPDAASSPWVMKYLLETFYSKGLTPTAAGSIQATPDLIRQQFPSKSGNPTLVYSMCLAPIITVAFKKEKGGDAVYELRIEEGDSDSAPSWAHTLREEFAISAVMNCFYASKSNGGAARDLELWADVLKQHDGTEKAKEFLENFSNSTAKIAVERYRITADSKEVTKYSGGSKSCDRTVKEMDEDSVRELLKSRGNSDIFIQNVIPFLKTEAQTYFTNSQEFGFISLLGLAALIFVCLKKPLLWVGVGLWGLLFLVLILFRYRSKIRTRKAYAKLVDELEQRGIHEHGEP